MEGMVYGHTTIPKENPGSFFAFALMLDQTPYDLKFWDLGNGNWQSWTWGMGGFWDWGIEGVGGRFFWCPRVAVWSNYGGQRCGVLCVALLSCVDFLVCMLCRTKMGNPLLGNLGKIPKGNQGTERTARHRALSHRNSMWFIAGRPQTLYVAEQKSSAHYKAWAPTTPTPHQQRSVQEGRNGGPSVGSPSRGRLQQTFSFMPIAKRLRLLATHVLT